MFLLHHIQKSRNPLPLPAVMHFPFLHLCVSTWWFEERRPLALVQVTWGGGFPGAKQLSSRFWPSWISAIDGWMLTTEELWSATQTQTPHQVSPPKDTIILNLMALVIFSFNSSSGLILFDCCDISPLNTVTLMGALFEPMLLLPTHM